MYKDEIGIIEVLPDSSSKEDIKEALYKKELLDAITMQDFSGKAIDGIIDEVMEELKTPLWQ